MAENERITKIKKNVWKLESGGSVYSVKKYDSLAQAVKVREVHEQLQRKQFVHMLPISKQSDPLFIMQPWIDAKAVNFKRRADRLDSFGALAALHQTNEMINWSAVSCLPYYRMLEKWSIRLARFAEMREFCESYLSAAVMDELLQYGHSALALSKKHPESSRPLTLLHGDVVHHNMLRDRTGIIRFIDFDLACLGDQQDEQVLWMHRVLPQVSYNLPFLLGEHPALAQLSNHSLAKLLYPNEVLREWLYLLSLPPAQQKRMAPKLLHFTDTALSHWPKLWYDIERTMK